MSYDPLNPQHQDPRHRQPAPEESADDRGGGIGGILGQILGGGQGRTPEQDAPSEDPRYASHQRQPFPQTEEPQEDPRISQSNSGPDPVGGLFATLLRNPRVLMALLAIGGAFVSYMMTTTVENNPVTGQSVRVLGDIENDIQMGLQAAPEMIAQGKGEYRDPKLQAYIDKVGATLVKANMVGDWAETFHQYKWDFHLLADEETINAFALPGGQIFFTYGLFSKLKTEDEVAGVLGHEIGHVIARHSAKQMAKAKLINGMVMAGATATSDGRTDSGRMAQMVANIFNMKYGRDDETQADRLGTQFMINAKYNPQGIVHVMEVLQAEMGGSRQPEFMSTHPNPDHRIDKILQVIKDLEAGRIEGPKSIPQEAYPQGVN